jgi:hypothetical protein
MTVLEVAVGPASGVEVGLAAVAVGVTVGVLVSTSSDTVIRT